VTKLDDRTAADIGPGDVRSALDSGREREAQRYERQTELVDNVVLELTRLDASEVRALLDDWDRELLATVPGFVPDGGSTVNSAEFLRPDGVFLLARSGPSPVGCGGIRRLDGITGEIKRLFVRHGLRGRGVGYTLLRHLEEQARELGYEKLRLDTAGDEPRAVCLFTRSGYVEISDYNGNPYAGHWFEKRLTGADSTLQPVR
jgi:GNAT superfamily N-acetyltransferase